jgi:allophanate hydrolase subunit 1
MEAQKVRKKATNKELTTAMIDVNQKLNHLYSMVRGFDSIFTIYLDLKGDKKMLEKKLEQLEKERKKQQDEQKKNGSTDKGNLSENTDGERGRAEGVRQKSG